MTRGCRCDACVLCELILCFEPVVSNYSNSRKSLPIERIGGRNLAAVIYIKSSLTTAIPECVATFTISRKNSAVKPFPISLSGCFTPEGTYANY